MPALRAASLVLLAALAPRTSLAAADEVPHGLQVTVDVFDSSFPPSAIATAANGSVDPSSAISSATPLRIGYHFGPISVLLGLSVTRLSFDTKVTTTTAGGVVTTTDASQSATRFGLAPTVRYYFTPLEPSGLSPYAQAQLDVGITGSSSSTTNVNGTTTTPSVSNPAAFGFSVAGGVEYLVSRHFGITGELRLRFLTASVTNTLSVGGGSVATTNSANQLSLGGTAGLNFHF